MKLLNHPIGHSLARALVLAAASSAAWAQTETLTVDILSGPYFNVTSAVQAADPGKQTTILIRGRAIGSTPLVYDFAGANESFPIALAPKMDLVWDSANSDLIGATPVPPILAGSGPIGGGTAISVANSTAFTRNNTSIDGLWIAGFTRGVDIRGAGGPLGIKLRNMTVNNCSLGVVIQDTFAGDDIDPLIKGCIFDNLVYPGLPIFPWGVPPPGSPTVAHVWILAGNGGLVRGKIAQSSFSLTPLLNTGATGSTWGIAVDVGASTTVSTEVKNCTITGNSPTPFATPSRGLDFGIGAVAIGSGQASMTIDRCSVTGCGFNGIEFQARGQGRASFTLDAAGWPDYDDETQHYVDPLIKNCSVTGNGFISLAAIPIIPELGHGIALASVDNGRMAGTIQDCTVGTTVAGAPGLGISGNADNGVMIIGYNTTPLPGVFEPPLSHRTTIVSTVERNDCFGNANAGVEVTYDNASGRPHVRRNRCYNNTVAGIINTLLTAGGLGWNYIPSAEVYNNFVYNAAIVGLPVQPSGILGGFAAIGPIAWYANSVSGMATSGIFAASSDPRSVLLGNIAFGTAAALDFVTVGTVTPLYCDGANLTGPTNTTASPAFLAPATGNLRLAPGSPVIDFIPTSAWILPFIPGDDFDGKARPRGAAYEIGAWEF